MFKIFKNKKAKVVENQCETTPENEINLTSGVPDVYWIVQWNSRFGEFSRDVVRTSIPFFSSEQAEEFAESLRKAHEHLRNTNDIKIEIIKIAV